MHTTRRRVIGSSLALAATALTGCSQTPRDVTVLNNNGHTLFSPDDCFVVDVYVEKGNVNKGDPLILLSSEKNDELLSRITMYMQMVQIFKRQISDGRRDDQLALQKSLLADLQEQCKAGETTVQDAENRVAAGSGSTLDVIKARAAYLDVKMKRDDQALKVGQFALQTTDIVDGLKAMEDAVNAEQAFLRTFKEKLKIVAPITGNFNSLCLKGAFYKKGAILGTF